METTDTIEPKTDPYWELFTIELILGLTILLSTLFVLSFIGNSLAMDTFLYAGAIYTGLSWFVFLRLAKRGSCETAFVFSMINLGAATVMAMIAAIL